ncbi:hypothetical protein MUB23_04150 [Cuneatibacter sp. NSJ-177]|uniref:hypothetical protein n=1 Tax=Cuneatibacter sp. NSJ-177 TaxID=2931401 RepID=UPI001FD47B5E|nr:hypothetical protein [Cuneatibacter sp. NSJ-177]MCJ7834586.1 hypothetical protein [Cuneatibacter sp. NSJ-177]
MKVKDIVPLLTESSGIQIWDKHNDYILRCQKKEFDYSGSIADRRVLSLHPVGCRTEDDFLCLVIQVEKV